jgi:hypothetical protein
MMTTGAVMKHLVACLEDGNLFGAWFSGSWATWKSVLKAAFAIPMHPHELTLFRAVADRDPPRHRVRELWCIVACARLVLERIAPAPSPGKSPSQWPRIKSLADIAQASLFKRERYSG